MIAPQPNPFTGEVDYEGPSESTYDTEEDLSAQDLVIFTYYSEDPNTKFDKLKKR